MIRELFEWLLKYPPLLYQRGDMALARPFPAWLWVAAAGFALVAVAAYIRRRRGDAIAPTLVLATLRLALIAALVVLLARPVLRVPTVVPRENHLAILIDDSRSMRIPDVDGETRADFARTTFAPSAPLTAELAARFRLRFLRFGSAPTRLTDWNALTFEGERTRIGSALQAAADELGSAPASGVVLVTDGADNGSGPPIDALLRLRAAGLPIFAVGLGAPELERDVAIARVDAPRSVLLGGSFEVAVEVEQRGFAGDTATVVVESDGRIVGERVIRLPADGETAAARVRVDAEEGGVQRLRARVSPRSG
ncbi:MAG: vWA domain-containing protein, partial [Gemmatimonadota bacterium]